VTSSRAGLSVIAEFLVSEVSDGTTTEHQI